MQCIGKVTVVKWN